MSQRATHSVPLCVWCAAIIAICFLGQEQPRPHDIRGIAVVHSLAVRTRSEGRLTAVLVTEGMQVSAGTLIARLDDENEGASHDASEIIAPVSGVIQGLEHRVGEFLPKGASLCQLIEPAATSLIAYLPEAQMSQWKRQLAAEIALSDQPDRWRSLRVLAISPSMVRMPESLRANPSTEEWAIAIHLESIHDAFPGQHFRLRFPDPQ